MADLTVSSDIDSFMAAADKAAARAVLIVDPTPTDLAGGTTLAVRKAYFDTISANRTFDALPTGTDGDIITLIFDVTGATRTLNFHTNNAGVIRRAGESGTLAAAVSFQASNHKLSLEYADGYWYLIDTGFVAPTIVTKTTASSYTIGTTDPNELYGGVIYVTGAATITIPAVVAGASFTVITIGAVAVSVDPNASDLIYLDGTALSDGDKITNLSTAGDIAVFTYYDATGWAASTNGWTDGN